jgi:hypothetical protein
LKFRRCSKIGPHACCLKFQACPLHHIYEIKITNSCQVRGGFGAHIIIIKGIFPQFSDIKNLAKVSKKLAKLVECAIEKQKKSKKRFFCGKMKKIVKEKSANYT